MIVEVFQRPDLSWAFRRIAMLGVQEDGQRYASRDDAVAAAQAAYPDVSITLRQPDTDGTTLA